MRPMLLLSLSLVAACGGQTEDTGTPDPCPAGETELLAPEEVELDLDAQAARAGTRDIDVTWEDGTEDTFTVAVEVDTSGVLYTPQGDGCEDAYELDATVDVTSESGLLAVSWPQRVDAAATSGWALETTLTGPTADALLANLGQPGGQEVQVQVAWGDDATTARVATEAGALAE